MAMWQSYLRVLGNVVLLRNYQSCDCMPICEQAPIAYNLKPKPTRLQHSPTLLLCSNLLPPVVVLFRC